VNDARVRALLAGACARDEIVDAPDALRVAACDTFSEGSPPLAILEPASIAALAAAVPRLVDAGIAIVPRGAGLSYSAGSVLGARGEGVDRARDRAWVAVDLHHVADVLEIHDQDAYVRVAAGCTWAALDHALAARGLRTPFRGPASGLHATIGGGLSNDALFHGSARYGTAGDSVLGLVVLLADGRLLRTGTNVLGAASGAAAFGPDLTRAFIGACGAFGLIVEATLRTIPRAGATRLAGYRCATSDAALAALRALGRHGDATEALALDPSIATLIAGLRADDTSVPGRAFARGAPYLLSACVDAPTEAEADLRVARVDAACAAAGAVRDGDGLLGDWLAAPFPPPQMLRGADGRRWVPVHGLVPHSRAAAALAALDDCMQRHVAEVATLDVRWSVACVAIGPSTVLVEANLTWPAAANPVIERYLGPSPADDPDAARAAARRDGVARLRDALAAALDAIGATHLQIGRFYPYRERLDPVAADVLDGLKRLYDPRGAMNPGILGLAAAPRSEVRS
jgi:FAD/FMN-containing dehydrogenase